jgi:hypothetical protein
MSIVPRLAMSASTLRPGRARRAVNGLPAPTARVARFPAVTFRLLRPALFPRADKPRKKTAMSKPDTTTEATHISGPWRLFDLFTDLEIVTDRKTAHETESIVQFKGLRNAKANARLMAAALTPPGRILARSFVILASAIAVLQLVYGETVGLEWPFSQEKATLHDFTNSTIIGEPL